MTAKTQIEFSIPSGVELACIAGANDENLHFIEEQLDCAISMRDSKLVVSVDELGRNQMASLVAELFTLAKKRDSIDIATIERAIELLKTPELTPDTLRKDVVYTFRGKAICPKTAGQKHYIEAIRANTITFGIGPAGTGKTYLAVAMALDALSKREVGRIILSRPIVEAGENLGFLPGTLNEKVDPYIRPLYDAIFDMMEGEKAAKLLDTGVIEIAPLAFMRGRTLNDSFIILDEAQNTTPEQMKMFLTRLGFGSKMVITGDATQFDIPRGASGLAGVRAILKDIDDIAFCDFGKADVVRHSLVARIVSAYDKAQKA